MYFLCYVLLILFAWMFVTWFDYSYSGSSFWLHLNSSVDLAFAKKAVDDLDLDPQFSDLLSGLFKRTDFKERYSYLVTFYNRYRLIVKLLFYVSLSMTIIWMFISSILPLVGNLSAIKTADPSWMLKTVIFESGIGCLATFALCLGRAWLRKAAFNKSYLTRILDYKPAENLDKVQSANHLKTISDMDNCLATLKTLNHIAIRRREYKYLPKSIRKQLVQLEIRLYLLAGIAMVLDTDLSGKSVDEVVTIMFNDLIDPVTMQRLMLLEDEIKDKNFWLKARQSANYKAYKRPVKQMLEDINMRLNKAIVDTEPLINLTLGEMKAKAVDTRLNTYLKRADQIEKLKNDLN